jgi:ABC-type oligopeptide transport system substrate-binding subunit
MRAGLTADRKRVFKPANAAVNLLRQMIDAAETESSDVRWLFDTLDTLVRWQSRSRDEATQLQLGVAALEQSRLQLRLTLPTKTRDALMNIALTMEPAPACEPEALRTRIEALKRILSEKER